MSTTRLIGLGLLFACGCRAHAPAPDASSTSASNTVASDPSASAASVEAPALAAPGLPPSVDLRPELERLGLGPRAQGARPTCSIFTASAALEFALARADGEARRMSPEYLNWAANQSSHDGADGDFFHQALAGFEHEGLCAESTLPYAAAWDPALRPPPAALEEAHARLARAHERLSIRWIVPWVPNRFGLDEAQFEEVRRTLAAGWPVAAGSGHSRLLVGYRDDASAPGGGMFLTSDSALAAWSEVSFDFVRREVADVFWVQARAR